MQVDVADTVGCGDSFAAAVVLGYIQNQPLETVLALANAVGAATATSCGAGRNVASMQVVRQLMLHRAQSLPGAVRVPSKRLCLSICKQEVAMAWPARASDRDSADEDGASEVGSHLSRAGLDQEQSDGYQQSSQMSRAAHESDRQACAAAAGALRLLDLNAGMELKSF